MANKGLSSKTMKIDIPPDMLQYWEGSNKPKPADAKHIRIKKLEKAQPQSASLDNNDLQELLQGVYDAAFITDRDGIIMDSNLRASEFFGYSREEFSGNSITNVILGANESVVRAICTNLEEGRFTLLQAQCVRADETQFPTEISTSQLKLSSQDYLCFFIRDITERREAEAAVERIHKELEAEIQERRQANIELQGAIAQLKKHDEAKTQFVSNVSHELKTPLTSITYMTGNMMKGIVGEMPESAIDYLEMMREDCSRLKRTVDDILDMSRIEAETLKLTHSRIHFSRFIHHVAESLRIQAESSNLTFNIAINCIGFVECDPQKMERAIYNVVKNAIKFNEPSGSIDIVLRPADDGTSSIVIDVTDSGIGIEKKHINHVTERYYRVGEYVSGAGLGLSICKNLMESHGGTLKIQSPPPGKQKGTMVSMQIPVCEPSIVLTIDDEEGIRSLVTEQLTSHGYNVITAESGETALRIMQEIKPDIILMDWALPGMNGGITITKIKANESLSDIPIIAITVSTVEASKREILQGLDIPVVLKPWDEEQLLHSFDKIFIGKDYHESG